MSSTVGGPALASPLPGAAGVGVLLEAMPDALIGVDRAGAIRLVNRQAEALFGYDRDALVGRPVETLVPQAFRMVHQGRREGYLADPRTRSMGTGPQFVGVRRDGTELPVDINLSHVQTGDGLLVIAAVRDMTARNEAEEDRRRSDLALAAMQFSGDCIIFGRLDGVVTSWNHSAETLFGYTSAEMVGKSASVLSPEDRVHEVGDVIARIISGQPVVKVDTIRVRKDRSVFPVALTVSGVYGQDGGLVGTSAIARDVSEQREKFEATERMAAITERSGDAIIGKTLDGVITSWNPAAERMYGYTAQEVVGWPIDLLVGLDRAEEIRPILATIRSGQHVEHFETIRVRKDGTEFPVSLTISPVHDLDGSVVGTSTIAHDLTEQRQAVETARCLAEEKSLVNTVLWSASVGIVVAGLDGSIKVVNRSMCDLLGYDEAWFLARRLGELVHPDDVEEATRDRASLVAESGQPIATQLRLVRCDGTTIWVRRTATLVRGEDGEPDLLMVQALDITLEHEAQETLAYQAIHDALTGLHNRAWILDILKTDLLAAKRLGTSLAALFVDLDNFKVVNDSLGHAAGDEVLTTVANRIAGELRPQDRVGRFGGDEFVIVVQDVTDVLEVERFAERVSTAIAADLQVRGHRIVPTTSIGIALSSPTSTPESLLRDTDSAMFRAKGAGRARWQFFDDDMHAQAVARLTVEDQLRDAITGGEFVVFYQPIVALADGRVVGHEALVRWMHPTRGLLSPGEFLDVAEDTRLINPIGAQVLDQVAAMLAECPDLPGPISVNVSPVQLGTPDWLSSVVETLNRHTVDPARLVIEITETAALSMTDFAVDALQYLRELGVGIHLDDFGTGYSSISVLRDLPVTGVKLDIRFVHDLTTGPSMGNALVHGLSGLIKDLHLIGIAEGIETQMHANILRAQGWRLGQGYHFGRPAILPVTHACTGGDLIA